MPLYIALCMLSLQVVFKILVFLCALLRFSVFRINSRSFLHHSVAAIANLSLFKDHRVGVNP